VPRESVGKVLIVGAGNGNDVAIALARGATAVDAVEIDPRLVQIGRERHPNRPYDDPRVRVHVDDGRAFLQRTDEKYDLIVFALPDSLTLVSGASALRLESYLFTRDAIEAARDHLTADGVFTMYNSYRRTWLVDRFAGRSTTSSATARAWTPSARRGARPRSSSPSTAHSSVVRRRGSPVAPSRSRRPTTTRSPTCASGASRRTTSVCSR
jgi:SAM-dependent methyltransferase